jgi:hypothetical protein
VGHLTINSGATFSANHHTLEVTGITNNGSFQAGTSTVAASFSANSPITITGNLSLYRLEISTPSSWDIINTLTIEQELFFKRISGFPAPGDLTGDVIYDPGATLRYEQIGNLSSGKELGDEWRPNRSSGAGVPHHVEVSFGSGLRAASGSSGGTYYVKGDLTKSGGTLLNLANRDLVVSGSLSLSNFNLGEFSVSDLNVGGDFTGEASLIAGKVTLDGNSSQALDFTQNNSPDLVITNTAGTVQLAADLALLNGAELEVASGGTLDLNGHRLTLGSNGTTDDLNINGQLRGGAGAELLLEGEVSSFQAPVVIPFDPSANTLQTLEISSNNAKEVQWEGGLTISGTATVRAGNTLTISNGAIQNNGTITIEDNASLVQTAAGANNNSGSGTYEVTNSVTYRDQQAYKFWSSPIQSATFQDVFGNNSSAPTNKDDWYRWEANNQGWSAQGDIAQTDNLEQGRGYTISPEPFGSTNPASITESRTFSGAINNGDLAYTENVTGSDITGDKVDDRYMLVGNPYPSALNVNTLMSDNGNLTGIAYFFDAANNATNAGYGEYATGNQTGTPAYTGGTTPDEFVSAGQGFFVEATADGSNTVNFNNNQRTSGNNVQFFKRQTQALNIHRSWFTLSNDVGTSDNIAVVLQNNATANFDLGKDAPVWKRYNGLNFYSILGQKDLAIQALDQDLKDDKVIPLGLDAGQTGLYTIALDSLDNWPGHSIALLDKNQDVMIDLRHNEYRFAVNQTGAIRGRFYLLISSQPFIGIEEQEARSGELLYFQRGASLIVDSRLQNSPLEAVTLRSVSGRTVRQATPGTLRHELSVSDLPRGVYLLETQNRAGEAGHHKVYLR